MESLIISRYGNEDRIKEQTKLFGSIVFIISLDLGQHINQNVFLQWRLAFKKAVLARGGCDIFKFDILPRQPQEVKCNKIQYSTNADFFFYEKLPDRNILPSQTFVAMSCL